MSGDNASLLQHPRRNLGTRYRTQAQKFARLASKDEVRFNENMAWAEQNARQALLHDFTDEKNWRCLADLKLILGDNEGLAALLEDLFVVLGRDPDQVDQLKGIDFLLVGGELLEAAFLRDPLDPDVWWSMMEAIEDAEAALVEFSQRCKRLDFSDQRANIVYGRRLERIRASGREDSFIELARHLLAHRPHNHELWMELGRLFERRSESDEAWLCYDHVQQLRPHTQPRDEFLSRLKSAMDGEVGTPWTRPTVQKRSEFLQQMQSLSQRISITNPEAQQITEVPKETVEEKDPNLVRLEVLMDAGDVSEAFFYARRLVAEGEEWAMAWVEKAKNAFEA
jgi:tetratricopeptide (TPR) repeat protein